MKVSIQLKELISVVNREDVDLYLKRPSSLNFTIIEKMLMVMGEVDICLRPDPLPPIIQVW